MRDRCGFTMARRAAEEWQARNAVDLSSQRAPWCDAGNDSDGEGFLIPPCSPQRRRSPASPAPGICGFTIADFHPGAAPADTASRQSLGMHHPNLHNCGVNDCPFSLSSPSLIARARAQGMLLQRTGSPTDHARVDHRAFPDLVQVKVRLSLLGFDRTLWGDLEHFTGEVQHRYYHEVTG